MILFTLQLNFKLQGFIIKIYDFIYLTIELKPIQHTIVILKNS